MSEKKRSSYNSKSKYDLPKWAKDDKKFAYRWIRSTAVTERTDGYDPRGWEKAKIPEGQPNAGEFLRYNEMILAKMPIEENERRKAEVEEATRAQTEAIMGAQAQLHDQMAHEFRNAGGKLKLNVSVE